MISTSNNRVSKKTIKKILTLDFYSFFKLWLFRKKITNLSSTFCNVQVTKEY